MAGRRVDATWAWCAPTETSVVADPPVVFTGGAEFTPAVPWQVVQVWATTSTMPFTWLVVLTVVAV